MVKPAVALIIVEPFLAIVRRRRGGRAFDLDDLGLAVCIFFQPLRHTVTHVDEIRADQSHVVFQLGHAVIHVTVYQKYRNARVSAEMMTGTSALPSYGGRYIASTPTRSSGSRWMPVRPTTRPRRRIPICGRAWLLPSASTRFMRGTRDCWSGFRKRNLNYAKPRATRG